MLVGDIIYNDEFDFNANYAIYELHNEKCWHELEPIFSTKKDGFKKPLDKILDMKVEYITVDDMTLIIEASYER